MDAKLEVQDFIAKIRLHSEIWDKSSRDHHNRYALEKTWKVIAHETNMTVKEAQTKWKSLRDYYRKEIRRLTETYGTDYDDESIGESTWPYFKCLIFLRDQFKPKKSETPLTLPDPLSITKNQESSPLDFMTVKVENFDRPYPDEDSLEISDSDSLYFLKGDQHDRNRSQGSFTHPSAPCKRRKVARNEVADASQVTVMAEKSSRDEYDEDRHFFESLLPHTKKIQGLDKMLFRCEVQNLIIKYAYSDKRSISSFTADVSRSGCDSAD